MEYLKRRLLEIGPQSFEAVADEAGVAKTLPRKIVYDPNRDNPKVGTVQPLLDYLQAVDRGERELPEVKAGA